MANAPLNTLLSHQESQPSTKPLEPAKITRSNRSDLASEIAYVADVNAKIAFNKINEGKSKSADAFFRTAISRAYYALLHHAIDYAVVNLRFENPGKGTHSALRRCYGEAARQRNPNFKTVKDNLGEAQLFRETADYSESEGEEDTFDVEDIGSIKEAYDEVVEIVNETMALLP